MNKAVLAIVFLAAAPLSAQTVKDYVEIDGANSNYLHGIGVVIGLNGNGDSPKGESAIRLKNLLQHFSSPERMIDTINAKNAAVVMVTAVLPPFTKKGGKIDVRASAVGDAKSIVGGMLMATDLRSVAGRRDPNVYAYSSGRVVGQGGTQSGNPTSGSIPSGAIIYKDVSYKFVQDVFYQDVFGKSRQGKAIRLNLRKTNLSVASQLAFKLNEQALVGRQFDTNGGEEIVRLKVARALDGGTVEVIIPSRAEYEFVRPSVDGISPYPGYYEDAVTWADHILNLNVTLITGDRAVIVINDTTKTVSWTGVVKVRPGRVVLRTGARITISQQSLFGDIIDSLNPAIQGQELIDAVRVLEQAGLLSAEVQSQ